MTREKSRKKAIRFAADRFGCSYTYAMHFVQWCRLSNLPDPREMSEDELERLWLAYTTSG